MSATTEPKEQGSASIAIDLTAGIITVKHGDSQEILAQWTANEGDWGELWLTIQKLKYKGGKV